MSDRTPAGDKGTADRIEADDGGYWVRLVTKQAMKREGVCMGNCLDSQGYGQHLAGNEEMISSGLWSLRKADGVSYLLVEVRGPGENDLVDEPGEVSVEVTDALGPSNSQPSGWSIRQLRHLVAAFISAGATVGVPLELALVGEDGRTWRPDKAPQDLKDAAAARRKAEEEAKAKATSSYRESAWCNMELRNGAVMALRGEHPRLDTPEEQREALEAAIARMEDQLASGSMMTGVGVETLRRMYRRLEALGGPPVQQGRLSFVMAPGALKSTRLGPGVITP